MEIWKGRPIGLTVISVLYVAGGFTLLVPGLYYMLFGWRLGLLVLIGLGVSLFVIGTLVIYEAYGLWQGYRWARTVLFVMMVLGIAYCIISFFESYLIIYFVPMLIDVLVIYYIRSESVKRYFNMTSVATEVEASHKEK